jgi:hypothetical protein
MAATDDLALVALSPADLAPTQAALGGWCAEKVSALRREQVDLEEHLMIATANGWKLSGLNASLNRVARRITYYEKIQVAVEAGYLVVPNFPVTTLAVRVKREKPLHETKDYKYAHFTSKAQLLPAGEGRYVDDTPIHRDESYTVEKDGKQEHKTLLVVDSYDEPDFPFALVKPAVLDATQRAMALKVFDEIGSVTNQSGDPIMVGRLLDPRGNGRCCTFFIAWWLNTAVL